MKRKILYYLTIIAIILFILYFFINPIVKSGFDFDHNMTEKLEMYQNETERNGM